MKIGVFLIAILISIILVHYTGVSEESFFEINNQITYLGILIGFALTLYTFGLSVLKDIYEVIETISFKKIENKVKIFEELKSTFDEIKSDIIIIFWCIIVLFINSIFANTVNPFEWDVNYLKIPPIISIFVFFISTIALYDIMKALFNLSNLIFKK